MKFRWWNILSWPGEIHRLRIELVELAELVNLEIEKLERIPRYKEAIQDKMRHLVEMLVGAPEDFEQRRAVYDKVRLELQAKGEGTMPEYTDAEADQILEDAENSFKMTKPSITIDEYNQMLEEQERRRYGHGDAFNIGDLNDH